MPTPLPPLQPGDFCPHFILADQQGKRREIQNYAGRKTVLFFLPAHDFTWLEAFFAKAKAEEAALSVLDFHRVYILIAGSEALQAAATRLSLTSLLWADEGGALSRAFGVDPLSFSPKAFVLNENLRILTETTVSAPDAMLNALMTFLGRLEAQPKLVFDGSLAHAPVLLVPEAISPALQADLLQYWENGKRYEGTIGIDGERALKPQTKRRTDVDLRDNDILSRVDAELCKRVYPELRKIACFDVTHRERYKIGRYGAEDQGFYNQHRDTGVLALHYRRYSMSIGLSEAYEGGVLEFTEYGNCGYKLAQRMAVLFPSSLMHRITPVTQGERYVMVGFLFGDAEEAGRRQYVESQGKAPDGKDLPLLSERRFAGVRESEAMYTNTLKIN